MLNASLVMHEEDYRRILAAIQKLVMDASAKGVFVVDRNGQLIAEAGEVQGVDTTSLASLTAGSIAATSGLARLIGEDDFPIHFHQGERDNLHINIVAGRIILVVVFDERSSLGLVRLRVKRASGAIAKIFEDIRKRSEVGRELAPAAGSPLADITDADIDNLFSD